MKITAFFLMIIISVSGFGEVADAYDTEHLMIVLIDGVRYTESLGDTTHTYCPRLWDLAEQGVIHDSAFNDNATYTAMGVPATWMGRFYRLQDTVYQNENIQFSRYPTFWEYARLDLGLPVSKAAYITPDYSTLWRPSFYPGYGPTYWPSFHLPPVSGNNNIAVFDSAVAVLTRDRPAVCYVYLPDTDHAGHSGIWEDYIAKIREADSLTAALWDTIQADEVMANKTTMIVTNDHGRHDDLHGGFQGHGCDCFGCRHVMLFAIGPDFQSGIHVDFPRASITDIAVTGGELLEYDAVYAEGRILNELFTVSYKYLPGDANMYNGQWPPEVIGSDVTYLVNYFRGLENNPACLIGNFYCAGDANGDCQVIGSDVTRMVSYFRGNNMLEFCPDYQPSWIAPEDLPDNAPPGWPNCGN
jgi:hypothetical protein